MSKSRESDPDMEDFQRVAGAFVHEFNNLFQTALGNLDLLSARVDNPVAADLVNETVISLERAVALTGRLNVVGNKNPARFARTDVNEVLAAAVAAMREKAGPGRQFALRTGAAALFCRLPPGQLDILLRALVFDGPAALAHGPIEIEADACEIGESTSALPAGAYVRITLVAGPREAPTTTDPALLRALSTLDRGVGLHLARFFAVQLGGACRAARTDDRGMRIELLLPADRAEGGGAPSENAPAER